MWLAIGFLCLVFFAALMICYRFTAEWRGVTAKHGDLAYEYRAYKGTSCRQIKVGMETSKRYDFVIRRQGILDRLMQSAGFDSDKKICHPDFDDSLIILSDDFITSQALAGVPGLSDQINAMFELGDGETARVEKLVCRRGRLWALVEDKVQDADQMAHFADVALPAMDMFTDALRRFEGPLNEQRADRFAVPAVACLLLASGFFTKGVMGWYAEGAPLIETGLFLQSIVFGSVTAVALAVLTIRLMHYNFKNHKAFAELFFVGMLGMFATIYAERAIEPGIEMVKTETTFDSSAAVVYEG
jgi:hypothetical protein